MNRRAGSLVAAIFTIATMPAAAQWLNYPTPGYRAGSVTPFSRFLPLRPAPLPELAVDAARMLLQKLGISPSKEKVSGTKTPFRGW
jgi:hypothetical protein